jgi:hypothetical protein
MNKVLIVLCLTSVLLTACGPGQPFGPTVTPSPTHTAMPTGTPTTKPTRTPTVTPTPLPGLGITTADAIAAMPPMFVFHDKPEIDGNKVKEGITDEGYSKITFTGSPVLLKAELKIDMARENSFMATGYWIAFLEIISHGGLEAAEWVHDNFSVAVKDGKVEKNFGEAKVILESDSSGTLFLMTIVPVENE